MNPLLMQMLAKRSGLPESASQEEIFGKLGESDPQMQMMMNLLEQKRTAQEAELARLEAEESGEADEEIFAPEPEPTPYSPAAAPPAADVIAEVLTLRRRCDSLALAVGACLLCWGESRECPHCGGRGRPGWREPDRPYFRAIVSPALERLRQKLQAPSSGPRRRP